MQVRDHIHQRITMNWKGINPSKEITLNSVQKHQETENMKEKWQFEKFPAVFWWSSKISECNIWEKEDIY